VDNSSLMPDEFHSIDDDKVITIDVDTISENPTLIDDFKDSVINQSDKVCPS
jgi:hypothetical protein